MHTVKINLIADQEICIQKLRENGIDSMFTSVNIYDIHSIVVNSCGQIVDYELEPSTTREAPCAVGA